MLIYINFGSMCHRINCGWHIDLLEFFWTTNNYNLNTNWWIRVYDYDNIICSYNQEKNKPKGKTFNTRIFESNRFIGLVKLTRYILLTTVLIEGTGALLLSTVFIPQFGILKGICTVYSMLYQHFVMQAWLNGSS